MGENGRKAVEERFTWDTIAEQTLAVYRQVCPDAFAHAEPDVREAPVPVQAAPLRPFRRPPARQAQTSTLAIR